FFGLGGLFGYFPIAVDMVCHIQPFAAGAFLPVLGIVIFPCFIMDAVFMNRNRLFLRIFADGAGTFSGTRFGCGRLLCYRPIIESMVAHFSFLAAAAFLPVLGFILLPVAVAVLMFKHWNGFGLHIVADRAVTLSGTSLGFGGRLRLSPIAVDMVCHIQPFAAGAFLPVLCRVVLLGIAVLMGRFGFSDVRHHILAVRVAHDHDPSGTHPYGVLLLRPRHHIVCEKQIGVDFH